MNLIEAIKSGRPYRRKFWYGGNGQWRPAVSFLSGEKWHAAYTETLGDIVADDWETLEPKVEITRADFLKAAGEALCHADSCISRPTPYPPSLWTEEFIGELAKRLGLGEPGDSK